MSFFRSIVFTSVLVGAVAGTAITAVQSVGTSSLIAQAEVFEKAGDSDHDHEQAVSNEAAPMVEHDHDHGEAWEPSDGTERTAFTLAANVLTAIGYSLLLVGLIAMRGREVTWRTGLVWGLAGFACVMLAPMLGLPPELPGTPSASLDARQMWWVATALCTACAIALLAFHRKPWTIVLALALLAVPHIYGAPQAPQDAHALAPESLEVKFVVTAAVTSLLLWLMIGSLGATVFRRIETRS